MVCVDQQPLPNSQGRNSCPQEPQYRSCWVSWGVQGPVGCSCPLYLPGAQPRGEELWALHHSHKLPLG